MNMDFVIYGANGYTGTLIAQLAVQQGLRPVLAGRHAAQVNALASGQGLDARIVSLDDTRALDALLDGMAAVIHCAGPFVHTAQPMVDACLRQRVHYLDITGEIAIFEALAARNAEAQQAGVMLLPGVGFDVVPSDCLAAHLKRRLPTADRLTLGIRALGAVSRGTALTGVESLTRGEGGMVRQAGKLTPVPPAWKIRAIDFGGGPRQAVAIPWGDVATAYYSTGIPNIEVYMALPPQMIRAMQVGRALGWVLRLPGMAGLLRQWVRSGAPGPTPEERARGHSLLWGEVTDAAGGSAVSRMQTPEGYTFTAQSALIIVRKVLAGAVKAGFQTPSSAYGADLALEVAGVVRSDE